MMIAVVMMMTMAVTTFADGTDGKITLTNAAAGQDYNLYKILDATYDATNEATSYYTTNESFAKDTTTPFKFTSTPDNQGRYYVVDPAPTIEAVKAWATKDPVPSYVAKVGETKNITSGNTIEWTGLEYGYYYVTSGLGAVVTIDSANKTAEIIDKNDTTPHTDDEDGAKKIVDGEEETTLATAAIGDTVHFKVSFTATNFVTKNEETKQVTYYQIVDTPTNLSNLAIDSITVGDKTLTASDYTANGQLTINIPWVKDGASIYTSPVVVTINYHATLDAVNASNDVVISNDGTTETIPGHTDIVTATLTINKVDKDAKPLNGAWFALTKADGTNVIITKITDGKYTVAKEGGLSFTGDDEANYIVAGTGVTVVGLDGNDTYTLVEKKAPAGYNMAESIPAVSFEKSTSEETTTGEDGTTQTTTTTTYTATATVVNQSGTTLPSTGGIGTTLFYVIGAALVLGSGVLMVSKKRMSAN